MSVRRRDFKKSSKESFASVLDIRASHEAFKKRRAATCSPRSPGATNDLPKTVSSILPGFAFVFRNKRIAPSAEIGSEGEAVIIVLKSELTWKHTRMWCAT